MRYRFLTADVFTDRIFGGNPLAVLPDAAGLDGARMQAIARELNLSETTFVLPPDDPAHARRVRIFTPARELPFAGHPTIGTALVLAWLGELALAGEEREIVLEEGAGPVPVRIRCQGGRPVFAELTAPKAPEVRKAPRPAALAPMLCLAPQDLCTDRGLPAIASCGLPFLVVEVQNAAALARARLERGAWQSLLGEAPVKDVFVITRDGAGLDVDFRARMFAPAATGLEEDPATGSAAAALGGWLALHEAPPHHHPPDGTQRYAIAQGLEMGRPSRLEVTIVRRAGELLAVRVGGSAVLVSEGTLEVPAA